MGGAGSGVLASVSQAEASEARNPPAGESPPPTPRRGQGCVGERARRPPFLRERGTGNEAGFRVLRPGTAAAWRAARSRVRVWGGKAENRRGGRFDERPCSDYPTAFIERPPSLVFREGEKRGTDADTRLECKRGKENACLKHRYPVVPAEAKRRAGNRGRCRWSFPRRPGPGSAAHHFVLRAPGTTRPVARMRSPPPRGGSGGAIEPGTVGSPSLHRRADIIDEGARSKRESSMP